MDIPHLNTHLVCGIILPDRSRSNLAVDVFGIKCFDKTDIEHFFLYQKNSLLLLIGQAPLAWVKSSYYMSSFFYDNSASCLCGGFNSLVLHCFFFPNLFTPSLMLIITSTCGLVKLAKVDCCQVCVILYLIFLSVGLGLRLYGWFVGGSPVVVSLLVYGLSFICPAFNSCALFMLLMVT